MIKAKLIAMVLCVLLSLSALPAAIAESSDAQADGAQSWLDSAALLPEEEPYSIEEYAVMQGLPNEWVNVLLLGTEAKNIGEYGDTDSITLMSINLGTKRAKLTSFMQDIWVSMDGRTKTGRLKTACTYGGPQLTMRTINDYFGLNVHYYVLINFSAMAEAIDELGGLDMDVTEEERNALNKGLFDLSSRSGMEALEASGTNVHLNGNQAVAYARIYRIDSEFRRSQRQRYLLMLLAKRLQQEDAHSLVGVVMKLMECVETNLNVTQLMTIAAAGMQINLNGVEQLRIPADKTFKSGTQKGQLRISPNFELNRKLLQKFIYE